MLSTLKRHKPLKKKRGTPRPGRLQGADLKALREQCFDRDGGKCRECGRVVLFYADPIHAISYHMAHLQAKRRGGDSLDNVRTLCGECHRAQHNGGKPVPRKSA